MENTDQIRPLTDVPDHGLGLLGGLAHSVLTEYAGASLPVPRLHLGQNTLPDPPFPMAAQVPFGDLTQGWRECGENLASFLEAGARALRTQPTPDISAFNQCVRILQRVLRFDSIVMVWEGRLASHAGGAPNWPMAAGTLAGPLAGRHGPGDRDPLPATAAMLALAVDRAGNALIGWVPDTGTRADIHVRGSAVTTQDRIAALLLDVLLAQYAWTSAVFGTDAP